MNEKIVEYLSVITNEEREILAGRKIIDRNIYMAGDRDIISGDKLITSRKEYHDTPSHEVHTFPRTHA